MPEAGPSPLNLALALLSPGLAPAKAVGKFGDREGKILEAQQIDNHATDLALQVLRTSLLPPNNLKARRLG